MLTKADFNGLLKTQGTLIIDGALATELETRGQDLNHALWSAKVIRDDPESITAVHLDYFLAGANIAITASYQASTWGLANHFGLSEDSALSLIKASAHLAQKARDQAYAGGVPRRRPLLVAGSVGPFGAFLADGSEYRGDYLRTVGEYQAFHRPRIQALVDAGVDLLALETMPSLKEIEALLLLLSTEFPKVIFWLGCTLKDADHLSDGTPLHEMLSLACQNQSLIAVGVNCVPMVSVTGALKVMAAYAHASNRMAIPLLAYPNSGEQWDGVAKVWRGEAGGLALQDSVAQWRQIGAKLVGGCCRTGPCEIDEVTKVIRSA